MGFSTICGFSHLLGSLGQCPLQIRGFPVPSLVKLLAGPTVCMGLEGPLLGTPGCHSVGNIHTSHPCSSKRSLHASLYRSSQVSRSQYNQTSPLPMNPRVPVSIQRYHLGLLLWSRCLYFRERLSLPDPRSHLGPAWLGEVCPRPADLSDFRTPGGSSRSQHRHCLTPRSFRFPCAGDCTPVTRPLGNVAASGVIEGPVPPLSPGDEGSLAPTARGC